MNLLKKFGFLISIIGLTNPVIAATTGEGFYLGAKVGQTNTHNLPRDVETEGVPSTVNVSPKNTGIGGGVFFGYSFNHYFGLEAGYTYYAPSIYDTDQPPICDRPRINEHAIDFLAKVRYSFCGSYGVFGKFGIASVTKKESGSLQNDDGSPTCSNNKKSNFVRPEIGFGVSYNLNDNWVTDLSFSRILKSGDLQNADIIALSISYHFVDRYCGQFLC